MENLITLGILGPKSFILCNLLYIRGLEGAFIKKPSLFSLVIILYTLHYHHI